jgi:hypothetical protein
MQTESCFTTSRLPVMSTMMQQEIKERLTDTPMAHADHSSDDSQGIPVAAATVNGAVNYNDTLLKAIQMLTDRVDKLSVNPTPRRSDQRQNRRPQPPNTRYRQHRSQPIICYKCQQPGHFARGGASATSTPRQMWQQGNDSPPA